MRIIIIIFIIVINSACTERKKNQSNLNPVRQGLTEQQKRKIFADSLAFTDQSFPYGTDSPSIFEQFIKNHYPELKAVNSNDPFIYALEEHYVDTTQIDSSAKWLRITVKPCFRLPYSIVLDKTSERVYLITKATNGSGCYNTGTLAYMSKLPFDDSVYFNVSTKLESLDFWNLQYDTTCHGGMDGETWTFEAIDKGKYNIINRWMPQTCGNDTTRALAEIGLHLKELSKFEKVMNVFSR